MYDENIGAHKRSVIQIVEVIRTTHKWAH